MEQRLFTGETPEDVRVLLRDNAHGIEETTHSYSLTEEEVLALQTEHAQTAIKMAKLLETKEKFMEGFKAEKSPIDQLARLQIQLLRTGVKEVTEDLYLLEDQDEGIMGYYNDKGVLIKQRPLRQDEKQLRINHYKQQAQ